MNELKNKCLMCFTQTQDLIKIFSRRGRSLKIVEIITRHFWFEIKEKEIHSTNICKECWDKTNSFHTYYCNVENLFEKYIIKKDPDESTFSVPSEIEDKLNVKIKSDIVESNHLSNREPILEHFGIESVAFDTNSEIDNVNYIDDDNGIDSHNGSECASTDHLAKAESGSDESNHSESTESIEKAKKYQTVRDQDSQIREYFDMQCELCEHTFETFTNARTHYRKAHDMTGYLKCCGTKIFRRGRMLEHIGYHMNPNKFQCQDCKKVYSNRRKLDSHQKIHNPNAVREFICSACGKDFLYKEALRKHSMFAHVKDEDKKYICDICDKRFVIKSVLFAHIRNVHQSAFVQVCDVCAKTFKNKYILEQHRKLHSVDDMPKLKCHICGALLKNEGSLRAHIRRHGDTETACKLCGKVAPNRSALGNHMRYVHSERIHKCTLCDKAFKKPVGLREHMASHTGTSLYSCPYCTRTFTSGANMHKHRKIVHPAQWLRDRRKPQLQDNTA